MPLIEIDDTTLAALAANGIKHTDATARLGQLTNVEAAFNKMLGGPKRLEMLKLYKEHFPDAVVPELDAAKPTNEAVEKLTKEFQDYKAAIAKEKDDRIAADREAAAGTTVSQGRTWLRREKQLDDEGVAEIEKTMQDLGIPNYEVAFNHWRAKNPAQATDLPASYAGRSLDWFQRDEAKPDLALALKDPEAFKRKEIAKFFKEKAEGRLVV